MPHRRCRKFQAIFLCGVMNLFLLQGTIYPAEGSILKHDVVPVPNVDKRVTPESGMFITVKPGDTLWSIAQHNHTTLSQLLALNDLKSPDHIQIGQRLCIAEPQNNLAQDLDQIPTIDIYVNEPEADKALESQQVKPASNQGDFLNISKEDLELLARVIYAEARGEDFQGQVAVGAVVLNRLKSPHFPKTIRDVIYQPGAFTAVKDKQIRLIPDDEAYKAAKTALSGLDPTDGALFYYNPRTSTDQWIKSRQVIKRIGNHAFSI